MGGSGSKDVLGFGDFGIKGCLGLFRLVEGAGSVLGIWIFGGCGSWDVIKAYMALD